MNLFDWNFWYFFFVSIKWSLFLKEYIAFDVAEISNPTLIEDLNTNFYIQLPFLGFNQAACEDVSQNYFIYLSQTTLYIYYKSIKK